MKPATWAPRSIDVSSAIARLAVAFAALVAGLLIVRLPPQQGLVVIAASLIFLAGCIATLKGLDDVEMFAGVVLIASAFADFPRNMIIGPLSGLSGLAVLYVFAAILMRLIKPTRARLPFGAMKPFWLFLFWAMLGALGSGAVLRQTQNLSVILVFILACTALSTSMSMPGSSGRRVWGFMTISVVLSSATYLFGAAIAGPGSDPILGARTYALVALIGLAWSLSGWRYSFKYSALITLLVVAGIFASLSRLAIGAALILVFLTWFKVSSLKELLRSAAVLAAGGAMVFSAVSNLPVLNERFFSGDVVDVGSGFSVNASGRANFWGTTLDSFKESPWVGHGPGSADALIADEYRVVSHPHNDYLRILHDYGIVGMVLFAAGLLRLLVNIRRAWARAEEREDRSGARIHHAAFLALIGVLLSMITDNTIAYVFVLAPVGIIVGLSLARIQLEARLPGARV